MRRFVRVLLLLCFCAFFSLPVFADEANSHTLYKEPDVSSDVVGALSDGETVAILERLDYVWSRVIRSDGTSGYCATSLLGSSDSNSLGDPDSAWACSVQPDGSVVYSGIPADRSFNVLPIFTTDFTVHLRSTEYPRSSVLCWLPQDLPVVLVSDRSGALARIAVNGMTGYVPSTVLTQRYESTATVTAVVTAVVRDAPVFPEVGAKTEDEARDRLRELSAYFEDGRYWNYAGVGINYGEDMTFSVTDTPCNHSFNGYGYCNGYMGTMSRFFPEYGYEMQCLGYADLLSDLTFGRDAPNVQHDDFSRIRVGDQIRMYYWDHSMLVTDVGLTEDGEKYIRVTDVNSDYENCQIDWDKLITESELYGVGDWVQIYTRYED